MSTHPDDPGPRTTTVLPPRWREEEYTHLLGQVPMLFAAFSGPRHVLQTANPAFVETIGCDRVRTGVPIGELMPELGPQGVLARLDEVYRTGAPYRSPNTRLLIGEPGAARRERYFDVACEYRRDGGGRADGVVLVAVDTTPYHDAQLLAAEQRVLLEQIARDAPLGEILDGMATAIEEFSPEMIVSVLLLDAEGRHLLHGTGRGLPDFYNEAIDGIEIGENVGSCGTSAYLRVPVVAKDIATDPRWADYREVAARAGLAACWSTPIMGTDGALLGTFAMYHRTPKAPEEKDLALSAAFTRIAALAIERHRTVEAGRAAQEREKEAREDLAFVLDASTAITREQHYADSLRSLARLTVPGLAPMCTVHVVEGARLLRRIAVAAVTPADEALLGAPWLRDEVEHAVSQALTTGTTSTGTVPDPRRRKDQTPAADAAPAPAPASPGSVGPGPDAGRADTASPDLRRTDGGRAGGTGRAAPDKADVHRTDPRHADADHADPGQADARQADPRQADPRHADADQGDAPRSGGPDRADPGKTHARRADPRPAETPHAAPGRAAPDKADARRVGPAQTDPGQADARQADPGQADALRSGNPDHAAPSQADADRAGPRRAGAPGVGLGYVCVPLTARGRTFGVLTLLASGRWPDSHAVALAEELARRAASSADNARQFTDRVRLAHDLQAGLLPPELPELPGATLAASYHPAGEGLDVGGDFYDVFPLPDDRWAFMIGDVCGRGALAATTTGAVRHTARAVARLLDDPAAVVSAINDALTDHTAGDDRFVSLIYGELRRTRSGLDIILMRAGHVPPLLRRADGTVEQVVQPGGLLGLGDDVWGTTRRVDLLPGDALVLVTDGITEARSSGGEFFGEERLTSALTSLRTPSPTAADLLDSLTTAVAAFAGDTSFDDQAALVVTAA